MLLTYDFAPDINSKPGIDCCILSGFSLAVGQAIFWEGSFSSGTSKWKQKNQNKKTLDAFTATVAEQDLIANRARVLCVIMNGCSLAKLHAWPCHLLSIRAEESFNTDACRFSHVPLLKCDWMSHKCAKAGLL